MCGRYSLWCIDDLCGRFRLLDPTLGFRSHFNIAPGSSNPVIVAHERAEAVMMQWGLVPHWTKDITTTHRPINARAENLDEKPMFSDLLKSQRCLVPASGFYEWKNEGRRKVPFYIHVKDDPVFHFPGFTISGAILREQSSRRIRSSRPLPTNWLPLSMTGCQ